MATLILRSSDAGAPALSGSNGTLCAVLDWALVQNGWAVEFTAANNRVYRAGTGNRRRLFVCHDSAVTGDARLALIRGCESATAAGTGTITDPFPTVAQVANASSTVLCSTLANTTARDYIIVVTPTAVVMAINCAASTTADWDLFGFGDAASPDAADTWATFCWVGGSATATSSNGRATSGCVLAAPGSSGRLFWCRTIDGLIKSSRAALFCATGTSSATAMGAVLNTPAMQGGYGNRIERQKVAVSCLGSSTTTAGSLARVMRGWIPNLWQPLHSGIGSVTSADVFHDTGGSGNFQIVPAASNIAAILETTDTWSAPSG